MSDLAPLFGLLERLPASYAGPTRPEAAPYGVVGVGEGTVAAALVRTLVANNFTKSGTQLVLSSPDSADVARTYAELAEVAGAGVRRISTGGAAGEVDVLVPSGALATYHFVQAAAYALGRGEEAQAADQALADLASRCAPHITEGNPARDLAWKLWNRVPLLLAAADAEALLAAWQAALARVAKAFAVPLLGDPLPLVTGAFEAQHERGDGRIALLLGDADPTLLIAKEVLESRIDEVVHVPYPDGVESGYAGQLALWYFGMWVAAYLAENSEQSPADNAVLTRAQAVLAGEEAGESRFQPSQRPGREDWDNEDDWGDDEEDFDRDDSDHDDV